MPESSVLSIVYQALEHPLLTGSTVEEWGSTEWGAWGISEGPHGMHSFPTAHSCCRQRHKCPHPGCVQLTGDPAKTQILTSGA